jgi:hypothetical protein
MPALTTAVPSDSPQGQAKKGVPEVTVSLPFARASKYHVEQGNLQSGIVLNTASPGTFNFPVPSYGFMTDLYLTALATGGTGAAAVYYEDAPWSVIQSIALLDVNGANLWGPFSGYSLFLAAKFGGYRVFPLDGPLAGVQAYGPVVAGTGAGAAAIGNNTLFFTGTTGNFGFVLPLSIEFGRDGLGSLPNNDASARYNLSVQIASSTASATGPVYTTAPTTYPTLSLALELRARSVPPAQDLFGNQNSIAPPAAGSVQFWSQQTASPLSGAQTLQLTRVGNLIRHHILVFRDNANGTRATAETTDIPPQIQMDWDANVRYVAFTSTYRQQTWMHSGIQVPAGVVWLPYTTDPDTLPIREVGDEWMATVGATKLTLRFTPAAAVQLIVLTNDFVATSPDVYAAGMLSMGY